MSKQNKITTYFLNDKSPVHKKHEDKKKLSYPFSKKVFRSLTLSKSDLKENDDCVIIDDDDECDIENINIENERKAFITEEPVNLSSKETFELKKEAEDIFSQELKNSSLIDVEDTFKTDDATIFMSNLVDEFLSQTSLHHLFSAEDLKLLNSFSNLSSIHKKKIFARTYWLKWKWHKTSYIINKYSSDSNNFASNAIKELIEKKLLNDCKNIEYEDWITILSREDLIKICKHFKIETKKSDKQTLLNNLNKFCENRSTMSNLFNGGFQNMKKIVINVMSRTAGKCVQINEHTKSTFDRLHVLMYLGANPVYLRDKQLNLLLMNLKNGKQSFPTANVNVDSPSCIFPSKMIFDEYYIAYDLYEQILKLTSSPPCLHESVILLAKKCFENYKVLIEDEDINNDCVPQWLHRFTPLYVYIKSLEISIGSFKALKTNEYLNLAVSILSKMLEQKNYRQHKRPLWYNEMALILQTRLHQYEKAANVIINALKENEIIEDAKASLKDRAKRLGNQKNITLSNNIRETLKNLSKDVNYDLPYIEITANALEDKAAGIKAKYVFRDVISDEKVYSSVENYALMHYINDLHYEDGEHWEGIITVSIFALLFWDIIYSDPETGNGIFISKFQDSPLDLYTDAFYSNRKDKIDERLHDIKIGWKKFDEIEDFMLNSFELSQGSVSLMSSNLDWMKLRSVIRCLGRNGLHCICERLSQSFSYAHSGFPDLTVWNNSTHKIKFVEVKGEGDKLSNKQIQWMSYLLKCGVETEVCYVSKGTKKRSIPKKHINTENTIKSESQRKKRTRVKKGDVTKTYDTLNLEDKSVRKRKCSQPIERISSSDSLNDFKLFGSPISNNMGSRNLTSQASSSSLSQTINSSPKKINRSTSLTDCYLKSPTKFCRGVGYFTSPSKSRPGSQSCKSSPDGKVKSPEKKRSSLSLTKRKIFEKDL